MVSDQDIAQALESLFRETNPSATFKLGLNLTHKVHFIRNQIHLLLRSHAPPQQQPPHPHQLPPKDRFVIHQNPNFHAAPSQLPPFALHQQANQLGFRPPQPPSATKTEAFVADVVTSATGTTAPAETPK